MFHPDGPTLVELTKQALASTTSGYDMLAPKFEHTPFRTPDALLEPMVDAIGAPVDAAMDVCCGTGAAMSHLKPLCRERVVGIDVSGGMLDQARVNLEAAPGEARVELYVQDTLEMAFDEEFDVITCCGAFGHILEPQQDRFIGRVRAALKPGGRFVFVTAPMPSVADPAWWAARSFNAVMHVRNALKSPPFIMFYLTFPLERASELLWSHGFDVAVSSPYGDTEFPRARLVVATKR